MAKNWGGEDRSTKEADGPEKEGGNRRGEVEKGTKITRATNHMPSGRPGRPNPEKNPPTAQKHKGVKRERTRTAEKKGTGLHRDHTRLIDAGGRLRKGARRQGEGKSHTRQRGMCEERAEDQNHSTIAAQIAGRPGKKKTTKEKDASKIPTKIETLQGNEDAEKSNNKTKERERFRKHKQDKGQIPDVHSPATFAKHWGGKRVKTIKGGY